MMFKFLIILCQVPFLTAAAFGQLPINNGNDTVVVIGNNAIKKGEFMRRMQWERAACFNYFLETYGVNHVDSNYWHHDFGGVTPLRWLKKSVLDKLREEQAELVVMKELGVLSGFSETVFEAAFEKENKIRKEKIDRKEVIYGVQAFDEATFHAYLFSNARLEAQRQILKQHPPDEALLKAVYRDQKEREYKYPPTITVTACTISPSFIHDDQYSQLIGFLKQNDMRQLEALRRKRQGDLIIDTADFSFSPATRKTDELSFGRVLREALLFSKAGQLSSLFTDENGDTIFLICRQLKQHGYYAYDAVRTIISTRFAGQYFDRMVTDHRKRMKVDVNEAVWNELQEM
ncbi:hypothetical protein [Chitinophaga sp. RAB17]|uniref:hypothetical protein n=1 Tax=Chitinophaga sp. RAB17 TaxID=3233049 RepID=UPI003F936CBA